MQNSNLTYSIALRDFHITIDEIGKLVRKSEKYQLIKYGSKTSKGMRNSTPYKQAWKSSANALEWFYTLYSLLEKISK